MRIPVEQFLSLRALVLHLVIALAAQGTFRDLRTHAKIPLYGVGSLLNAVLDGILIFILNFGIGGAAVATVISE